MRRGKKLGSEPLFNMINVGIAFSSFSNFIQFQIKNFEITSMDQIYMYIYKKNWIDCFFNSSIKNFFKQATEYSSFGYLS